MRPTRLIAAGLLLATSALAAAPALAQTGGAAEPPPGPVLAGGAGGLPAADAADTVRTNLWLVEALMAEIAGEAADVLPDPPATVRLEAVREGEANDLFRVVAARVMADRGYEVVLPAAVGDTVTATADHALAFDVLEVGLTYPEVGRTLGIWRRWVSRALEVTATVEVTERPSGRLLMADRLTRGFHDRLENDAFPAVNSDVYDFTSAGTSETGWKRRTEELVVLGTLAGLIAVYFANTGN